MKKALYVLAAMLIGVTAVGCKKEMRKTAEATQPAAAGAASTQRTGTVVEFINAGSYTYVQIDTGEEKIWAAAPAFQVANGDRVVVPTGMPMRNYKSESLGRTFEVVYFAGKIVKEGSEAAGGGQQLPEGHPQIPVGQPGSPAAVEIDLSGIVKAKGGKTVAEVHKEKAKLSGKEVAVRGKVVKYSSGIMGKNWIHLRDGTGAEGTNDLTITSDAVAKVGDTVLVRGVVVTEKDFGFGYKYPVIMEDAKVTVE